MEKCDIIIPVFNGEGTILSCLKSISAQNRKHIGKVIIISDGSTDNTNTIITRFIHESDLMFDFVCLQKNTGVANARNIGLKKCQSKWIAFLDADDIWLSNKLDIQFKALNLTKSTTICSDAYFSRKQFQNIDKIELNEINSVGILNLTENDFLKANPVIMSSLLIRRDQVKVNFRDEHHEDYIFCIENRVFDSLTYVTSKLLAKKITPNSLSSRIFKSFLATNIIKYNYLNQSILKIIFTLPFYIIQATRRRLKF
jgi:glycosyltransferase involved in cell wall biosynthesis